MSSAVAVATSSEPVFRARGLTKVYRMGDVEVQALRGVDVRVVLWNGTATKVPATALFTTADQWSVFALRDGRARLQRVGTGQMSDTEVEITAGLRQNDTILVHPSDQIHDGVRVSARR